tara:strand:+ start:127 stop:378 length:252 start_codon:yes stop_codon:yes gene_type:complete
VENLIHDAWVLFTAIGGWMANRLTQKIDSLDKRLDQLRLSSIDRKEYKADIGGLHIRCNDLEKRKEEKVTDIRLIENRKETSG